MTRLNGQPIAVRVSRRHHVEVRVRGTGRNDVGRLRDLGDGAQVVVGGYPQVVHSGEVGRAEGERLGAHQLTLRVVEPPTAGSSPQAG